MNSKKFIKNWQTKHFGKLSREKPSYGVMKRPVAAAAAAADAPKTDVAQSEINGPQACKQYTQEVQYCGLPSTVVVVIQMGVGEGNG